MILLTCPQCGNRLKVNDKLAGKKVRCPHCKQVVNAPAPQAATVAVNGSPEKSVEATLVPDTAAATSLFVAKPLLAAPVEATLVPDTAAATAALPRAEGDSVPSGPRTERVNAASCYTVSGEIARGGMGAILRAVDQDIHREVAVKFLLNPADARQRARFVEEAQITGQLEHPNIVPIHQLGVHEDGRCFFAMKMVRGRSLAQILQEPRQDDTLGRLLTLFVSVCNAVAYAHARKVLHRDLKPANIMVGDFGEVYVMDWGLAKVLGQGAPAAQPQGPPSAPPPARPGQGPESNFHSGVTTDRPSTGELTQAGAIMGTPAYMAPEQAQGDAAAIDERADIYALGAILYEILTLTPPVGRGGDVMAILMRVNQGKIEPPETRAPQRVKAGWIPAELSAIAMKALARKPEDRYPSAAALRRDIELYLEGRSVSAKQDSAWEMFTKLVKRNRRASPVTGAALIVLVVVVGIAFHLTNQERIRAEAARDRAKENYQAFLQERGEKDARTRVAAPALLRAARLLTADEQFADALAQVNIALDYDPQQIEAYLLKGQLLIGLERYQEAVAPLAEYVRREPANQSARQLADLAARPEPDKAANLWDLWEVFDRQKAVSLAARMTHLAERFAGPNKELLPVYRKRIDTAWPGLSGRLTIDRNGNLDLRVSRLPLVRDLSPLKGMKLAYLDVSEAPIQDLEPLRGMPLTRVNLGGCKGVKDLEPLRGIPLTFLNLAECKLIEDLEPLRGMPLATLNFTGGQKLRSINPLASLKNLTKLSLDNCQQVKDLGPLRGLPLTELKITCYGSPVSDLEPLRGMRLTSLNVGFINLPSLDVLKGLPLTKLELREWKKIQDLEALRGMQLTELSLAGCAQVKDFALLKEMPLTHLHLSYCGQIQDLEFLRGLKLHFLHINVTQVQDLGPLAGMELKEIGFSPGSIQKGMDILRDMKSLSALCCPAIADSSRRNSGSCMTRASSSSLPFSWRRPMSPPPDFTARSWALERPSCCCLALDCSSTQPNGDTLELCGEVKDRTDKFGRSLSPSCRWSAPRTGASHQTGWTGTVAALMHFFGTVQPERLLATGRRAVFGAGRYPLKARSNRCLA